MDPGAWWPNRSALVLSGGYVFKCLLDNTLKGPYLLPKWAFLENPSAFPHAGASAGSAAVLAESTAAAAEYFISHCVCEACVWMSSFLL